MDLTCHLIRLIHVPQRGVDLLKFIICPRRFASILNLKFDGFHPKSTSTYFIHDYFLCDRGGGVRSTRN